ncbi:MAG TPA: alpha/beta fold hydrolase [Dehalococcoidia bacterium]|nr:alpha/beta fold hydrolase [Dehalococcoidia bacterium]
MTTASIVDDRVRDLFFRYDREMPLEAEARVVAEENGVRSTRFAISSTHGERVTGLLWQPAAAAGPLPAILMQHGAGSRKEDDYIRLAALRWAREGFACIAIDASGHGEREPRPRDPQAIWQLPWTRRDHAVQMCVDLQRTVDYLATRPEIDLGRPGFIGFSMGTINGVPFVARDERVKAAVFCIGGATLSGFRDLPDDPPRIEAMRLALEIVDPSHFAGKIAPRPVLCINGRRDETVPPAAAQILFDALGEPKRIVWYDGGHTDMRGPEFKEAWQFLRESL